LDYVEYVCTYIHIHTYRHSFEDATTLMFVYTYIHSQHTCMHTFEGTIHMNIHIRMHKYIHTNTLAKYATDDISIKVCVCATRVVIANV
jgi:hypothetical protein